MSVSVDSFLPIFLVLLPASFGALILAMPNRMRAARPVALAIGAAATFALVCSMLGQSLSFTRAWAGWGMDFSLKFSPRSGAMILAATALTFLIAVFASFKKASSSSDRLFAFGGMCALAMANGALLANNLVAMLFFWQGMWLPLFLMIRAGGENAWRTSVKALFTTAAADLTMILGIVFTSLAAESMTMDAMHAHMNTLGTAGFLLMAVGAAAKLGAIPFHGWMYNAAEDAPSPFMALIPGSLNLLLGANLLSQFPGMFEIGGDSFAPLLVMIVGAGTVLVSGFLTLTAVRHQMLAVALTIAQGGALILGVTTSAGGVFAYAAIFAATAGVGLFLSAGVLDGSKDRKKPLVTAVFYLSALVAVAVAFSCAICRIALTDGVLGLILSILSLIGAILAGAGIVSFARRSALNLPADQSLPAITVGSKRSWLEATHCDPYPALARAFKGYGNVSLTVNDAISWFYDVAVVWFVGALSGIVRWAHNGNPSRYVLWVLAGVVLVIAIFSLS